MSEALLDRAAGSQMAAYSRDTVGAYQLLQQSGFTPFQRRSPLSSALNQVFGEFSRRTGIDADPRQLEGEFLAANPAIRRSLNPYDALQQTFSAKSANGAQAPIVAFLNGRVDEHLGTSNPANSASSGIEPAGVGRSAANASDGQRIKSNFYDGYAQLNRILAYFQQPPGTFVNLLA